MLYNTQVWHLPRWKPFLTFSHGNPCLLGVACLRLRVWGICVEAVRQGPTGLACTPLSSSIIDLCGLRARSGYLPPLAAIYGQIDRRGHPCTETRGQLQRPPTHFLPPGVPFWTENTFPFCSLHPPLLLNEQVKDVECAQVLFVSRFNLLLNRPHEDREWEIIPIQTPTVTHLFDVKRFDLIMA